MNGRELRPAQPALARALAEQAMAYPYKVWGFGEGVALRAVWEAGRRLDEPRYAAWVLEMLDRWIQRDPPLQEADHSAPGYSLLDAYDVTGQPDYLERALALARYMTTLPGAPSGAWYHRPQHPEFHHFLYVDCMEVDAPFFCRLAQVTGEHRWYTAGAAQIEHYASLLQDNRTGLFFHQFDGETGRTNGAFWGRGNGWAMLGLLETLTLLPAAHPAWERLRARFQLQAEAVAVRQLSSGDWPTVLDDESAYAEASLAAMFGYAFARAVRQGLLPDRFRAVADRAWDALATHITRDGRVEGVSVATPPGDAAHYRAIPLGGGFPWGQGPALLFCLCRQE